MVALTSQVELSSTYALVATGVMRVIARPSKTCQVRFVPTADPAPVATDPAFTLACTEPVNFENLGSACDVYAKGDGILQLFTNTV